MSNVVTRRGVYLDLTQSPYEYNSPYGDCFKFSSKKKLEIYTRDIVKELNRVDALIERNNLRDFISAECQELLTRGVYRAFYKKIEV